MQVSVEASLSLREYAMGRRVSVRWFWFCAVVMDAAVAGACNSNTAQRTLPTIALTAQSDTQQTARGLSFTVTATDDVGLQDVRITYSGAYVAQIDTAFTTPFKMFTEAFWLTPAQLNGAAGLVTIVGRATDDVGNFSVDTLRIFLQG